MKLSTNKKNNLEDFEIKGTELVKYKGRSSKIVLPNTITEIHPFAFEGCDFIKSVTIPDSIINISCHPLFAVFAHCPNLEELIVDKNNNKYYSQDNCVIERESKTLIVGCKNSVLPVDITSIGEGAFCDCHGLKIITIPNSVISIGLGTFSCCKKLKKITIPNSVINIGEGAFSNCNNLTSINYKGTKKQWNAITKDDSWDYNTGNYTIHCIDGDIAKDGKEI